MSKKRRTVSGAISRELVRELIDAAVEDPTKAARLLAENPGLKSARYIHDETPLHFLAIENYPDGVRCLAKLGIDINAVNAFGATALVDVLSIGRMAMAILLLQLGARPDAASDRKETPLELAIQAGHTEVVELLLKAGAAPPSAGSLDWSLVFLEGSAAKAAVLELLHRYGVVQQHA